MNYVAIIGVGSNLGDSEKLVVAAQDALNAAGHTVIAQAPWYRTKPVGPPQPEYLNTAFRVQTHLVADALMQVLLRIEKSLGRVRDTEQRWGPRVIDLDLLWHTEAMFNERVQVPHPRLVERAFALAPLLDVAEELAPDYAHLLDALGGRPPLWQKDCEHEEDNEDAGRADKGYPQQSMSETRKDKRQMLSAKFRYKKNSSDEFVENHSQNLSKSGVFVVSEHPLAVGTLIEFELLVQGDSKVVHGVGCVVWTQEPNAQGQLTPGMGVRFVKMDAESQKIIQSIVGAG